MGWPVEYRRKKHGYFASLVKLLTHLLGTAVMFSAILVLSWGLSYLVHRLNRTHPFPVEIYSFVTKIELWLLYVDVALSAVVLLFGAARFLQEFWDSH